MQDRTTYRGGSVLYERNVFIRDKEEVAYPNRSNTAAIIYKKTIHFQNLKPYKFLGRIRLH